MSTGTRSKKSAWVPVVACTEHRGVFFGYAEESALAPGWKDREIRLKDARMAIAWGTTRGVMELAETGPTSSSRISARADIDLCKPTAFFRVTPEAEARWKEAR